MGALFAFGFAVFIAFFAIILLVAGIILWKKVRIISIVSFVFSGICFLPILFIALLVSCSVIDQHKMKQDYIKENGKLFAEIVYGNKKSVYKELLKTDNLNIVDKNGRTPLYNVATRDISYLPIMEEMIERGADPNIADERGSIPLHAVVHNIEKIKLLIDKGSDINRQDKDGYTPLMLCVEGCEYAGEDCVQITQYLVSKGCNVGLKNNKGETAIDIVMYLMKEEEERCKDTPDLNYSESKTYLLCKRLLEIMNAS